MTLAQPAVLHSATEEEREATEFTTAPQIHPPTHTPSVRQRPRPTPSPNEDRPNLKRVKPQDNTNRLQKTDGTQGAPDKDSERQAAIDAWREANLARIRAMTPEARAAWEAELAEKRKQRKESKERKAKCNNSNKNTRKIDTYFNKH